MIGTLYERSFSWNQIVSVEEMDEADKQSMVLSESWSARERIETDREKIARHKAAIYRCPLRQTKAVS